MKLQAGLNSKLCLKQSKTRVLSDVWRLYRADKTWLKDFATLIYNNLFDASKNNTSAIQILNKLYIHNSATQSTELRLLLERIFALMSGKKTDPNLNFYRTQNQVYAEKLFEGLMNCTTGFHDRVNSLWSGWYGDKNFSERLETLREELVQRVASSLYDEVHAQNSVTKIARNNGLGIRAINYEDPYQGNINRDLIVTSLTSIFEYYYTPMQMVMKIEAQLLSELNIKDYKGRLELGKTYLVGEYGRWLEHLNTVFPNQDADWLLTAADVKFKVLDEVEDYNIIDLNWSLIRKKIFAQLKSEGFLSHDDNLLINASSMADKTYYYHYVADKDSCVQWIKGINTLSEFFALIRALPKEHELHKLIRMQIINNIESFKTAEDKTTILLQVEVGGNNALMLAVLFQPTAVLELLKCIVTLTDEDKVKILRQAESSGHNALMIAARHQPTAVPELLKCIATLTAEGKAKILRQVTSKGHNALMLAVQSQSTVVPELLEFIATLTAADKAKILLQVTSSGYNALMLAVQSQSTAVPELLEFIATLTAADKAKILLQVTSGGYNALMVAAQDQPTAVPELLKCIAILTAADRAKILLQAGSSGHNALMVAAQYQPTAVLELLKCIAILTAEDKAKILLQAGSSGHNALMLAAQYQPTAVPELLKCIAILTAEDRAKILLQVTSGGYNALIVAAQYQPTAVPELLKCIAILPAEGKAKILLQVTSSGHHALMVAAQYQPTAVPELLKCIAILTAEDRAKILLQVTNSGHNALMLAAQYRPTAVLELLKCIATLPAEDRAKILLQVTNSGHNALMLAAQCQPTALPDLLTFIADLSEELQITKGIGKINLQFMSRETLLDLLSSIKDKKSPGLIHTFILKQQHKFTPEDWYNIVNDNLLPAEKIKSKKEVVYEHIAKLSPKNPDLVSKSLNRDSYLGTFFNMQRGVRACGPGRGTFKRLENLQKEVGKGGDLEDTQKGPVN